jgi:hypothetical protein
LRTLNNQLWRQLRDGAKERSKKQICLANVSIGLPRDRKRTPRFDDLCRLKDLLASQGSSSEYPKHMASEEIDYQNHQNDRILAAPIICSRNIPLGSGASAAEIPTKIGMGRTSESLLIWRHSSEISACRQRRAVTRVETVCRIPLLIFPRQRIFVETSGSFRSS